MSEKYKTIFICFTTINAMKKFTCIAFFPLLICPSPSELRLQIFDTKNSLKTIQSVVRNDGSLNLVKPYI